MSFQQVQRLSSHPQSICFSSYYSQASVIPVDWEFIRFLENDGVYLNDNNKAFLTFADAESSDESDEKKWVKKLIRFIYCFSFGN